jgi:4-alpha-glucanotransferase
MTSSTQRIAGVLLHISSLPSGDLGEDAYRWVDFLADCNVSVWQTLPINMPHSDNSPYQCLSAHAGNHAFISVTQLIKDGYLMADDVYTSKQQAVELAFKRVNEKKLSEAFALFCTEQASWLTDYAHYFVLRKIMQNKGWQDWDAVYKTRDKKSLEQFAVAHVNDIELIKFTQFIFFSQWRQLKNYAHTKQVKLFGDIPIFVAYDSADVWAKPHLFKLDNAMQMMVVAGVPPDYFSATGQRWGNPHYQWLEMAKDNYAWWKDRIATQADLFDYVRIDHFRGLQASWEIPVESPTAMDGEWVEAPGDALLTVIKQAYPTIELIAEDLGIITPEVDSLRIKHGLPGMKILQFAFGGDATNPYLPENIEENSVAYTGTHDNDTTLGWYEALDENSKNHFHHYIENDQPQMPFALMDVVFKSKAFLAIVPMQDILGLDGAHRMNLPGTTEGNWLWRFDWATLTKAKISEFKNLVATTGRVQNG